MKIIVRKAFPFLLLSIMMLIFAGCSSEQSATVPEKYNVNVQTTISGIGLANVMLKDGTGKTLGSTNNAGLLTIKDLAGEVKITPSKDKYTFSPASSTIREACTVTFNASSSAVAFVKDNTELSNALGNNDIEQIILETDLSTNISSNRLVDLNLNGKTITGNVVFNTAETGKLNLVGPGKIDGDLTVDAKNASVINELQVTGTVNIEAVSTNSWDEDYDQNSLNINASGVTVRINKGAARVTVNGADNKLSLADTVTEFAAISSVSVTGSENIQKALISAPGVELDNDPVAIDDDSTYQPVMPDSVKITLTVEDLFEWHFDVIVTNEETGEVISGLGTEDFILKRDGQTLPLEDVSENYPEKNPGKYTVMTRDMYYSPRLGYAVRILEGNYEIILNNKDYPSTSKKFTQTYSTTKPYATDLEVDGTDRVGKTLTGSYNYNPNDNGDAEAGTTLQWKRAAYEDGPYYPIDGATDINYTLVDDDEDKYIKFAVLPEDNQNNVGTEVASAPVGPIEAKIIVPYATDVSLNGNTVIGSTLEGSYTYNPSDDGYAEDGTIYQWFRSDTPDDQNPQFIQFETDSTYTVRAEDVDKYIIFDVLVIDSNGTYGDNTRSEPLGPITAN